MLDKLKLFALVLKNRKQVGLILLLSFGLARAVVALTPCEVIDGQPSKGCKDDAVVERIAASAATFISLFGVEGPGHVANTTPVTD